MRSRPVSFVKAHLAEMIDSVRETREPVVITQNGTSTAVLIDLESYERSRQALAMLKVIAMGEDDIAKGRNIPQSEVFRSLRTRVQTKAAKSKKRA